MILRVRANVTNTLRQSLWVIRSALRDTQEWCRALGPCICIGLLGPSLLLLPLLFLLLLTERSPVLLSI